jgi:mono/diheme cytochrome c family protein
MNNLLLRLLVMVILTGSLSVSLPSCAQEEGGEQKSEESVFEVKKEKAQYGKIKHVDVGETVDPTMAKAGLDVFDTKCSACHKYEERYVGPALGQVAVKRTPEYIMNMILDTETMIENDDTVKCLMQEFLMRMPNQSVDEKDARNVLEHLRDVSKK